MLEAIDMDRRSDADGPFSGWIFALAYEFGEVLEPAVGRSALGESNDALVHALWCPDAYLHDSREDRWWYIGEPPALADAAGQLAMIQRTGPVRSEPVVDDWPSLVARAIEYIRAGDIFQVNLTRRLSFDVQGDPREFARAALDEPQCAFGAYLEFPGGEAIVSMSPELFLDVAPDGVVTSCPIKGTLPATEPPEVLWQSAKDAAELHMIVDLVRNDLGRTCTIGSVEVSCPRRIETYPTVHHGVAEVRGCLRGDAGLVDVLRATFPAGSITGAPKIRAMQIARELEACPRGVYCGAIGMLGPGRSATLSVAIRTATIRPGPGGAGSTGVLQYGTGCGVVADSDPLCELAESQAKAQVLFRAVAGGPSRSLDNHDFQQRPVARRGCRTR